MLTIAKVLMLRRGIRVTSQWKSSPFRRNAWVIGVFSDRMSQVDIGMTLDAPSRMREMKVFRKWGRRAKWRNEDDDTPAGKQPLRNKSQPRSPGTKMKSPVHCPLLWSQFKVQLSAFGTFDGVVGMETCDFHESEGVPVW